METGKLIAIKEYTGKYQINENYRPIAKALVEKYSELQHVPVKNILFLDNTEDVRKKGNSLIYAQISKVPAKWEEIIYQITGRSFEFVLEIFKENIAAMSREQIIALVYHELRHIQIVETRSGKKLDLVGHDVEDWLEMVEKLGLNWAETRGQIPDLLANEVDWSTIEGPMTLFPKESALKLVK